MSLPPGLASRSARALQDVMENRWDRFAMASILVGVVVRVVWGLVIHPPFDYVYSDMAGYVGSAQKLAAGADMSRYDAFFPPGTHILLAAPFALFGTERAGLWAGALLWCALSAAIPFFAWRLARLLLTPAAAALTALFCALWPLYVTYGGFFTSETPALAFLLASLWTGYRALRLDGRTAGWLGLAAGLLGGVAVANRPQLVLNLAVLAIPALFCVRRQASALIGIVAGTAIILVAVVLHNSAAADRPTGLSENAGMNFWMGHCDVRMVTTVDPVRNLGFAFGNPVWQQLQRGGTYYFQGYLVWDQDFFYEMGRRCIERDGLDHIPLLARNVLNMTATTIPWPQSAEAGQQQDVVRVSNLAYSLMLPIVIYFACVSVLERRRPPGRASGRVTLLLHLACVLVVAIFIFGDPRVRSTYDVFGLALLAACLTDLLNLDEDRNSLSAGAAPSGATDETR